MTSASLTPRFARAIANLVLAADRLERGKIPVTFDECDGPTSVMFEWGEIGGYVDRDKLGAFYSVCGFVNEREPNGYGWDDEPEADALSIDSMLAMLAKRFEQCHGRPPTQIKPRQTKDRPRVYKKHKLGKGEQRILEAVRSGGYPSPVAMAKALPGNRRHTLRIARKLQQLGLIDVDSDGMRATPLDREPDAPLFDPGSFDLDVWELRYRERIARTHTLRCSPARIASAPKLSDLMPMIHQLVAVFRRKLPPVVNSDELMAAALLGAWDALRKRDPERNFNAYARMRIGGAIVDWARSQDMLPRGARKSEFPLSLVREDPCLPGRGEAIYGASTDDPEGSLTTKQGLQMVLSEVDRLPCHLRGVVERLLSGERAMDIAADLGLHKSAVTRYYQEAVGLLQLRLRSRVTPAPSTPP